MDFVRTYTTTLSAPSGTGLGADITSVPSTALRSLASTEPTGLSPDQLGEAVFGPDAHIAAASFESVELGDVRSLVSVALLRGEEPSDLESIGDLATFIAAGAALYAEAHPSERALVDFVLVAPVTVVEPSWPHVTHLGAFALAEDGASLGVAVAAALTPIAFLASNVGMIWITIGGHVRQRMRYRQLQAELDELDRLRALDRLSTDQHESARKGALDEWLRSEHPPQASKS